MEPICELGFVSSERSESGRPEIVVITLDISMMEICNRCTQYVTLRTQAYAQYLTKKATFEHAENRCGFWSCCRIVTAGNEVRFHFELCSLKVRHIAATLSVFMHVLNTMLYHKVDHRQDILDSRRHVQLYTVCEDGLYGHGHLVSGWVFPLFGAWLMKMSAQVEKSPYAFGDAGIAINPAQAAMQETWHTVARRKLKRYKKDCEAIIGADGRFSLMCFGNACDVSIYPDGLHTRSAEFLLAEFSSHNLDTATQQLTLIAGLARMVDMARE